MSTFKYYIPDLGEDHTDARELKSDWDKDDLEFVAQEAGEDYHDNYDGWEDTWPIEIVLLDEVGEELGTYTVHMEAVPEFSAYRKEDNDK